MTWYEGIIISLGLLFGGYAIAWSLPGAIVLATVALGSVKHIVFIDKQLAKDLAKYYDENGYMRPQYQVSYSIGTRFINYCIVYPFIRHRQTVKSVKFKAFMWLNSTGYWGYIILFCSMLLLKLTGYKS
ncbi:MAG: hypothetical protein AAGJ88_16835 [Pseudomonadota bacterium]